MTASKQTTKESIDTYVVFYHTITIKRWRRINIQSPLILMAFLLVLWATLHIGIANAKSDKSTDKKWGKRFENWYDYALKAHFQGEFEEAAQVVLNDTVNKKVLGNDHLIWLLDKGKILQDAQHFEESIKAFQEAEALFQKFDEKAKLSVTEGATSAVFGGARKDYRGTYAERILINYYQAINWLAENNFEEALVHCRKAGVRQQEAIVALQKDIEKREKEAVEHQVDLKEIISDTTLNDNYPDLAPLISEAYSDYQNPIASYLTALLLYQDNDSNANVDLQKVHDMVPENQFIATEIERGGWTELDTDRPPSVYVICEFGLAPDREEKVMAIPSKVGGVSTLKLPSLQIRPCEVGGLTIKSESNTETTNAAHIASIDSIVAADFQKVLPSIVLSTIINTALKEAAGQEVQKQNRILGAISKLGMEIMYKTDLRTWHSPGSQFQIAHVPRPDEGVLEISVLDKTGSAREVMTAELPDVKSVLVIVRSITPEKAVCIVLPINP